MGNNRRKEVSKMKLLNALDKNTKRQFKMNYQDKDKEVKKKTPNDKTKTS